MEEIAMMVLQYAILGLICGVCVAAWKIVQQYNLEKWVKWAVMAWEMYFSSGHGKYKKENVTSFLREKFPKVDYEELDILIEKAVFEKNRDKKNSP